MPHQLRLIQPAKPRLGLYLRPGRNDHTTFLQLLAEDRAVSGLVLDARHLKRHQGMRDALIDNGIHSVLDPDFMELSTPGGAVLAGLADLPWSGFGEDRPSELQGARRTALAESIAAVVEEGEFSAALAPTHYLESAADPYFGSDRAVAASLRAALDRRGLTECCVFYPLAMPAGILRSPVQRAIVADGLRSLEVDAIWLRLHPFGTANSGSIALRRYLDGAWDLQRIGKPLVGEHTGTVGLALMAFGAVGGIESGITFGERFDVSALVKPRPAWRQVL